MPRETLAPIDPHGRKPHCLGRDNVVKKALRDVQDCMLWGSCMSDHVFEVSAGWFVRADLLRCENVIEFDTQNLLRKPKEVVIDIG
jgi:hypothetical protein